MAVRAQGEAAQVQGKGKGKGRVMHYQIDYEDLYNFGSDQDGEDNEDDLLLQLLWFIFNLQGYQWLNATHPLM